MSADTILVVDSVDKTRDFLAAGLAARGFHVHAVKGLTDAFLKIGHSLPIVIVVDYQLCDGTAFELMDALEEQDLRIPSVILGNNDSSQVEAESVKRGFQQFISRPVDIGTVDAVLHRVILNIRNSQKDAARRLERARYDRDPFLGQSAAILQLKKTATRLANTGSTVLIQGETGTGKGVLARWLHKSGPRSEEAFVDLNCAGLSRELLESELFGYQKGAFTGAENNKLGLLEAANRGIVFLDEIGDMEQAIQPKMLKVVEERRFHRLGDIRERNVDVQIIAATHRDLKELVAADKFRGDLYFRISAVQLRIPPLRERLEDLPMITDRLLSQLGGDMRHGPLRITDEARDELEEYSWPGNIRELRNVLERAALLSEDGIIREMSLEFETLISKRVSPVPDTLHFTLAEIEKLHISRTLEFEQGNVPRTAERLGVPKSSLYAKIRLYGLSSKSERMRPARTSN